MHFMSRLRLFGRSSLICLTLGVVILGIHLKKIERPVLSPAPSEFRAENAHSWMVELSKKFPGRVAWSHSRQQAAQWLKQEFKGLGYQPQSMPFSEVIGERLVQGLENIYVEKKGTEKPDEIIAVVAHYDVAETTVEGAMDDASGVGTVLELARIFAHVQTKRTLLFLLTDSEEFGAFWGAHVFVRNYPHREKIIAALNFDFVAPEKQVAILSLCDGLKSGYTPLWLREMALESIRSFGRVEARDLPHVVEHLQRALLIPAADHGEFLAASIPALNWVGQTKNFAFEMGHYHHTRFDVVESMQIESFETYGTAAERLVRSIDLLDSLPSDFKNSSYWKLTSSYYLEGWVVFLLHILAFIPFLVLTLKQIRGLWKERSKAKLKAILWHEAKGTLMVIGAMALGYVVLLLLPQLGLMQKYEHFPATQKSPLLYRPDWLPIWIVCGAITLSYILFRTVFSAHRAPPAHPEARHALHSFLMSVAIVFAMMKNSYLATLLLLPPAYFWAALRARKTLEGKLLNGAILLGSTLTLSATLIVLATQFHLGVIYWYLFLAASYGLISAYSISITILVVGSLVRLFHRFVLS